MRKGVKLKEEGTFYCRSREGIPGRHKGNHVWCRVEKGGERGIDAAERKIIIGIKERAKREEGGRPSGILIQWRGLTQKIEFVFNNISSKMSRKTERKREKGSGPS